MEFKFWRNKIWNESLWLLWVALPHFVPPISQATVKVNNLAEEFSALLLESNAGECTLNVPRLSSEIKRARPPFLTASARYDYWLLGYYFAEERAAAAGRAGVRIMPGRPFCHQCQRVSQRSLCSIEDRIRTCRTHQSFILHLKSKNIHHGKCCYSFIRLKKWSSTCDSTIGNENFGRTSVKFQNFPAFFEKGYIFEKKTTGSTNEWKTRKYYRTFRNVLKLKARQANWWWPIYLSNAHISKKWYFFIDDFKDLKIDTFIIHKKFLLLFHFRYKKKNHSFYENCFDLRVNSNSLHCLFE